MPLLPNVQITNRIKIIQRVILYELILWTGSLLGPTSAYSSKASAHYALPLHLGVGEQRLLHFPNLHRYSLSENSVRAIRAPQKQQKDSLLIKGIRPGTSDLWIWKQDGKIEHRTIRVQKWSSPKISNSLLELASQLQEVEVIASSKHLILRGPIESTTEAAKIYAIRSRFKKEVVDLTTPSPHLIESVKPRLHHWIDQHPRFSRTLKLSTSLDEVRVTGNIPRKKDHMQIETQLKKLFPLIVIDLETEVSHQSPTYFSIYILELSRKDFRSFGLDWNPNLQGAIKLSRGGFTHESTLETALRFLRHSGSAKILAQPKLTVRTPGEAQLFTGGEIPLRTKVRSQSKIQWKSYGLKLDLKILDQSYEQIRMDIQTELSHLDANPYHDSLPAIRTNQMKTQVDAQISRPLLLCGLLQGGSRSEDSGVPFLSKIPLLGTLFKTTETLIEESELVVILVPHKNSPIPENALSEGISFPKGPIPAPRNWISPSQMEETLESPHYPWNALQE